MNDQQPTPDQKPSTGAPTPHPSVAGMLSVFGELSAPLRRGLAIVLAIFTVLLLALWWVNHDRISVLEREFARRIQDGDTAVKEARVLSRQALDQVAAIQTRVGVLESKLSESQSQQLALEQLYQELSRSRDEWALAEIEQTLAVAAQQLQLAGNVQGAIIALQNADNRLARTDKPQFIALRRVLARDTDRLKALPAVDVAGSALRLDSLVAMVDGLPMLIDEKPAPRPRLDARPVDRSLHKGGTSSSVAGSIEWLQDTFRYGMAQAWDSFQKLVRVREVDTPAALLLAPDQAFFVRENLKLRLLNARLALLARQEATYRADLLSAQDALQHYFDTRSRQTVAALALLKQVQASNTVVELPTLAESMNAVRNFKAPRER
jgi:uroporphyrin-3 C-methyltransferase